MVKLDTFCLLYKCSNHLILIYITPLSLEIIDPIGFLSNNVCYSKSILVFLASYSKSRVLMTNPPLKTAPNRQYEIFSTFICLRQNGYSFPEILSRFL